MLQPSHTLDKPLHAKRRSAAVLSTGKVLIYRHPAQRSQADAVSQRVEPVVGLQPTDSWQLHALRTLHARE